ncbi:MAG TPA: Rv3235 family protein [Nocardioides sp.]|uniref:Rv3235 family protein n=1 Tax=Nocardioides sp. TaxID=35761 RepID=UPI002E34F95E|nr:Rv3235 family protein [Nocardioides sp.]HEX5088058.1 Rv3235 family protein [Nocardioides sp.]
MTVTPLRVPVASVQGTLALDLGPRREPPEIPGRAPAHGLADVVPIDPQHRGRLEQWVHRFVQATVEIVAGDRPVSQLLRWTSGPVYTDLHRRAILVGRAGGHQPGTHRVQPVRPRVVSVHASFVSPAVAEASARIRYGPRSRALAMRFEKRGDRWLCTALEFA